jgi:hypothetical protein
MKDQLGPGKDGKENIWFLKIGKKNAVSLRMTFAY